jgi:hypothetical protein
MELWGGLRDGIAIITKHQILFSIRTWRAIGKSGVAFPKQLDLTEDVTFYKFVLWRVGLEPIF